MTTNFTVTDLDLSGFSDEDLQSERTARMRFLKTPGTYNFTITEATFGASKVDGAGKKWGSLRLLATENGSGDVIKTFLDVPMESAVYTAKNGNTSKVKTQIFVRAMQSLLGSTIMAADIPSVVKNLETITAPGATFRASVKYKSSRITKNKDTETFAIELVDGSDLLDENGNSLTFPDYESASNYYQQIYNHKPKGLEIVSYLAPEAASISSIKKAG